MQATSLSLGSDELMQSGMLEQLFSAAPEAMLVVDAHGMIRLANPRTEELFAYAPGALIGRSVDTLVPAQLAERHRRHRGGYRADPRTRQMGENLELSGRRADGSEFPIDVALGPVSLDGEHLVIAIVRDVTDRKLHHDGLRYLSEHDALTGLLNRRGLDRQLGQALAHARRHGVETAVMLIDLDGFKAVNDRLGHIAGDRLLCRIVQAVGERLRAGDTFARLGGDEFAIVVPFAGPLAAESIGRELLGRVSEATRETIGDEVPVTASIGIAAMQHAGQDPTALIAAADAAMYEAKRAGGNAVSLAAP